MDGLMLIVDDAEVNREVLRVLFQSRYDIMMADSGEEALAILESCQGSIDIVLLDLQLPGLGGMELLKKRRDLEYFKNVPVVIITSSSTLEDQVQAFALGANDYVQKPFVPEIVLSRVSNVMASSRRLFSVEMEAEKLRVKSETDEMTGLLNKTTTEMVMTEQLKVSGGQLNAMMVIDIDNFKTVNDTSGHQAGDHVLKIVANLISSRFRKTDFVGRIGGDEFCVLMVDVPSMKVVYQKVNELIQIMRYKPNLTIPEYVTLSIGLATNEQRCSSYPELFKKADAALYQAKTGGRARYCEFGVESLDLTQDWRPVAVLVSNNRSVCSTVHALLPTSLRVTEALRLEDLSTLTAEEKQRAVLMYVDISDRNDDTTAYWAQLKALPWVDMSRVFAICREGCVTQYMAALGSGVRDMFTSPIEPEAFKRRTARQLEELRLLGAQGM